MTREGGSVWLTQRQHHKVPENEFDIWIYIPDIILHDYDTQEEDKHSDLLDARQQN